MQTETVIIIYPFICFYNQVVNSHEYTIEFVTQLRGQVEGSLQKITIF